MPTEQQQDKMHKDAKGAEEREDQEVEHDEEQEIHIENLSHYLDSIEQQLEIEEDAQRRRELIADLSSLKDALSKAGTQAESVLVESAPSGVLGFYAHGRVAITWETLESDNRRRLFTPVLIHEEMHAKRGIADEGLAQIATSGKTSSSPADIYVQEKAGARRTFSKVGLGRAFELYDIRAPQLLIKDYLKVSLTALWYEKLRDRYRRLSKNDTRSIEERIHKMSIEDIARLEREFEKGAPRLIGEAIRGGGLNFEKIGEEFLARLAKRVN